MALRCFVQERRTKQKMDQFILQNPQISVQHSVEFMKKLTVVAVSSISFLRNVFPVSAFTDRNVEGLPVKILKATHDVPGTKILINWLKSALDAVHKHYLKKLMLVFERQNESIQEVYTFNFTYNREAISCHLQGGPLNQELLMQSSALQEDINKSTQQLLRSLLILTTTLQPLPDDCEVSMNLEFHDDIPDDFDLPEHFIPVDTLNTKFPNDNCYTLKIGKVESRFTSIALSSKSIIQDPNETVTLPNKYQNRKQDLKSDETMILPNKCDDSNSKRKLDLESDETVILPDKYDDSNKKRKLDLVEEEADSKIIRKHIKYATIQKNKIQPVIIN